MSLAVYSPKTEGSLVYLIQDDLKAMKRLSKWLTQQGFHPIAFTSTDAFITALQANTNGAPLVVIMDLKFGIENNVERNIIIKTNADRDSVIPFILTAVADDLPTRLTALRCGSKYFLKTPVDGLLLANILRELTNQHLTTQRPRVLYVDDDRALLKMYSSILQTKGIDVLTLSDPLKLLDVIDDFDPDLLILDFYMPNIEGPELAAIVRDRGKQPELAILFLSSETRLDLQTQGLALGGDDFMLKPVLPEHLISMVMSRIERVKKSKLLRQNLETTLYEREREHLTVNSHAIVSMTNNKGIITYVNNLFCKISGYDTNELIGQSHRIIKSEQHPESFYRKLWQTISKGNIWRGEICNKNKNGEEYWVESTIVPFLDQSGYPYQYVSIRTDITRIKNIEHQLSHTLNLFEKASEAAHIVTWEIDINTMELSLSNEINDIFEIEANSLCDLARLKQFFVQQEGGETFETVLNRAMAEFKAFDNEFEIVTAKENQRWLRVIGLPQSFEGKNCNEIYGLFQDITSRKKVQLKLEQSENRLNFLVSACPVTIYTCTVTPPFGATYISPNIVNQLGFEAELFISDPTFWFEHIHPDDQQQVTSGLSTLFLNDELTHEYRFQHLDGKYRWMRDEIILYRDKQGNPHEIVGSWVDITDRKIVEHDLTVKEERLRRGQNFANIGTWDWDIKSGNIFCSERVAPLFGYTETQIHSSYDNFLDAVYPEDRQKVKEAVLSSVMHDSAYNIEHRIVWPDGTIRWMHLSGAVVRDEKGTAIQMLGVVQDIDKRKRIEQQLLEAEQDISLLLNSIDQGVFGLDLTGSVAFINKAACEMLGYQKSELIGQNIHELIHHSYQDGTSCLEEKCFVYQSIIDGRNANVNDEVFWRADGEFFPIEYSCAAIIRNHCCIGSVVCFHNITKELAIKDSLYSALEQAEKANNAKSEFISNMSHELRTPLNAILGFGQLLQYDNDASKDQLDNVNEILVAGHHLLTLINEILDLAKIETGDLSQTPKFVSVRRVTNECLSLVSNMAEKNNIKIDCDLYADVTVFADYKRLKQVLINLLSNAIKYNRVEGSISMTIYPTFDNKVRLMISDTGYGIPNEHFTALFEPFNRLGAENSNIEGTGIGLAITKRIIEMMGSTICVESELEKGSSFWFDLPFKGNHNN